MVCPSGRGCTEFEVGVNYHEVRGAQSSIPKPVIDALGHPDKIRFVVKNKHVEIESGTIEKG
jgi:hypothetical protein